MRNVRNAPVWPYRFDNRPGPSSNLTSNGGDFVVARRALLSRYAIPWLSELHDLDSGLYGRILFENCVQAADDREFEGGIAISAKDKVRDQQF